MRPASTIAPQQADRYLDALIGEATNRELRTAFLASGPKVIDYLSARTDVQFLACGKHPDYRSNMPGAAISGRAIVPVPFDGRLLGADFARIRPPVPEFMVFGGMMVGKADIPRLIGRFHSISNFIYSAKLFARYLADRLTYRRGTRIMMGNALIGRLFFSLRKRKVPVLFGARIADLIGDARGVTGARVSVGAEEIVVKVRKGVVLATGGYAHNKRFRDAFMPQPVPVHSMSCEGNLGDGIEIGQRLGAATAPAQSTSGLWTPVSIVPRPDGSKGLFPHLVLDRAKPGLIAVNSAGHRFVNEAVSYHDFVLAMFESHQTDAVHSGLVDLRCGFSRKIWPWCHLSGAPQSRKIRRQRLHRAGADGWTSSPARSVSIPCNCARRSSATTNLPKPASMSISAKGETELNRFNGDPDHAPNPCIGSLSKPPFYALAVWPADIAVSTGLATDADARVLGQ